VFHQQHLHHRPAGEVALLCHVEVDTVLVGQRRLEERLDGVVQLAHPGVVALLADHALKRDLQVLRSRLSASRVGADGDLGRDLECLADPRGDDIFFASGFHQAAEHAQHCRA